MRKQDFFGMPRSDAITLLDRAACVYVSSTTPGGAPIFRALDAAVLDGRVVFHGAPVGEKTEALGRACVVSAVEIVAEIPSHFVDPEGACAATTLYRSVQVHGELEAIEEPAQKTAVLRALMAKHQPEGGFVPLDHEHPLYAASIASVMVTCVSLARIDGKAKLAQNRTPAERARLLEQMWERGAPGDPRAIDLVVAANADRELPAFLRAPKNARFVLAPEERHAREVAELSKDAYWNDRFSADEIARAHVGSIAWIVLEDDGGRVVASARAISDGHKRAWIYDVIVAGERRGEGLGTAVVRTLLDHPAMRRVRFVNLGTRDAAHFYARMGFRETASLPARPYALVEMSLAR